MYMYSPYSLVRVFFRNISVARTYYKHTVCVLLKTTRNAGASDPEELKHHTRIRCVFSNQRGPPKWIAPNAARVETYKSVGPKAIFK